MFYSDRHSEQTIIIGGFCQCAIIPPMYEPQKIEPKWQKRWLEDNAFSAKDQDVRPKYYCLDMFPYPSAQGLHVGHPEGYTATDIVSRYKRMHGMNVLHPMGWDAFGLPAENFAIKTGVHPDASTHNNIKNFTRQIQALGFSYDWDREVDTSSPEYYKWTQWMFLQMYEHGLAYRKKAKVNWCNSCQTVLANEQVVDGKCERSGDEVVQKDLEQWFFKTTDYADQLLNDLDTIDWPQPIKLMQKNWIGRSEGAEIEFQIKNSEAKIKVYTTRPDTLFGGTYLVLAPDHQLVNSLTVPEQQAAVQIYQLEVSKKTELERTSLGKEKTGVFTGSFAINPSNNQAIPIWIADYVLSNYGTGAIMAVPAHDERDREFAEKFSLPVVPVIDELGKIIESGDFNGLDVETAKWKITESVGGIKKINYKMRDWLISRQRYWGAPIPIVYDPEGKAHPVKVEHLPVMLPTDVDYLPKGTSPLGTSESYKARAEELYGKGWHFEVDTMDTFVCSSWYYLRYCDPHNDTQFAAPEKLAQWLPVDMYVGGAEHAVLHLLYARFFHKALQDFGFIPKSVGREPFKALRNQGMILGEDHQKMSKSKGNVVNPDEIVGEYGADTMRLYEMFMGPFEDMKPWQSDSIKGVRRFLDKLDRVQEKVADCTIDPVTERLLHATIKQVTEQIEQFKFNTAISQLMILTNRFAELDQISQSTYETTLLLVAPFAPHLAEELWSRLGHKDSVTIQTWPKYDPAKLVSDTMTIIIQVNGKVRDQIQVSAEALEVDITAQAQRSVKVVNHIGTLTIRKIIYVPKKLVNIVVG